MSHECNGMDIIIALVLNEINPLSKHRMDLVMELKVYAPLSFCIGLESHPFTISVKPSIALRILCDLFYCSPFDGRKNYTQF